MKLQRKILSFLLIFVFLVSVSSVVAQDTSDASELTTDDDVDESLSVSENEEVSTASNDEVITATSNDDNELSSSATSNSKDTTCTITVDVLDKNIKVGQPFKVKVTVINTGKTTAKNVVAGFDFLDLLGNSDYSFKLLDSQGVDVILQKNAYVIKLGSIDPGYGKEVVLTFLPTKAGNRQVIALVLGSNVENTTGSVAFSSVNVSEASSNNAKANASSSKRMHETGNPLALLALSLFAFIPYSRRRE